LQYSGLVAQSGALRCYFTLDGSTTAGQISVTSPYNQCDQPAVKQFSGNVYYVDVNCSAGVAPGGQSRYRKEIQFRITSSGSWDPANDWPRRGLAPQRFHAGHRTEPQSGPGFGSGVGQPGAVHSSQSLPPVWTVTGVNWSRSAAQLVP
jgi:endoglucanase